MPHLDKQVNAQRHQQHASQEVAQVFSQLLADTLDTRNHFVVQLEDFLALLDQLMAQFLVEVLCEIIDFVTQIIFQLEHRLLWE